VNKVLFYVKILGYVENIHYINSMKHENIFIKKRSNLKYNHNDDYFKIIDTEKKAYILGFIIADGTIDRTIRGNCITNRLGFNNSIDDLEIIEQIKNEISPESILYRKNIQKGAKFRKEQVSLRITSFILCEDLINIYNIIPKKTLNKDFKFNFSKIPEKFHKDFIRGFFDGDGSVSFYKTKNTIFFNFSFIFNSKDFAEQIGNMFKNLFDIKPVYYKHIGKTCDYYNMRFNYNRNRTNKIKEIYDWFYKDSTIFLKRKKIKFDKYFEYRANSIDNTIEQCNA